ncbi:transporter [Flaviflexus salsibiostraticola]|uniref:Transporter n=1 Tax=Flaviflexus salsibiostraticola TaxID=1282737 RepID=A0A3S8ZAT7_9ACTO|nr:MMPL family transporter [Flaviflexus salsibiostraticola]AZN30582.1 transporter [Flaviflexus salsibiostraticola]
MSRLLARLGAFSFRRPLLVLTVWLLVLVGTIGLVLTSDTRIETSVKVDGTPAQEVLDEIQQEMPEAAGTQGSIAFNAADGRVLSEDDRALIARTVRTVESGDHVVDRMAMRADQMAELESTITDLAYEQAAEQMDEQLAQVEDGLSTLEATLADRHATVVGQIAALDQGAPVQPEPWQAEMMGSAQNPQSMLTALPELETGLSSQMEQVGQMRTEVDAAQSAAPAEKLEQVSDLMASLDGMTNDPEAAALLHEAMGPDTAAMLASSSDPIAEVDAAVRERLETMTAELENLQRGVAPTGEPLIVDGEAVPGVTVSDDGTIAVYSLQLTAQLDDLPSGTTEGIISLVESEVGSAGLVASPSSSLLPIEPPIGGHEAVGVLVAAVVLVLTLGSLVAAGLPILTALVGVAIGVGGAFGLSEFYPMTSTTPVLALMLGLAVGIDYALFILHKQRALILGGMSAREATSRAVGTSGSAVVFAGLTVVIALLGLLILDITFVSTMALAAAATVTIAVLISITALPALLGLVGERIVSLKHRGRAMIRDDSRPRASRRWAQATTARPWIAVLGVTVALGLLAVPAADMRLGMPTGGASPVGSPERTNSDLTAQALGEGANGPLLVAVERSGGDPDTHQLQATLAGLTEIDGVANAALRGTSADRSVEMYEVTPESGPMSEETELLVNTLREPGVIIGAEDVGVTGLTAINIDLSERLADAIPVYLAVVAGLSLIVLTLVFRSLVIPIAATAGFLLTIGATFGLTTAVFGTAELGRIAGVDQPGTVLSFLPIMAAGILYGLAMDYQLFIGTSIREARVHGAAPRESVISGFTHSSRVVVAAALIMVSVFGVFILTDDMMVRQFGFALAVGILIDAFLVRMTLMPAVISVAGRAAWWLPAWLDRILPDLDVEGSTLDQDLEANVPKGDSELQPVR